MPSRLPQRIEFTVHTSADPKLCWEVFIDWEKWNSFLPGIYKKIEWTKGEPWALGSRVHMEMLQPVEFNTECVIIGSSPPNKIGWIHHEMQNMVEQWISFLPDGERGSNISIWLEINGRTLQILGRDVVEVVREFKQEWYRRLAQRCDELTLERKDRRRA
ncbi:MAG: hypothetical protein DMG67_01630 [Acidobacteria bacterium]|nr:MAG: hypothetical protein DMG67_01630 [Acidobacteriota bacterium]